MSSLRYFSRIIFLGFLFSWVATGITMHEIEMLVQSPFKEFMARDLYYGYETIRTYYEYFLCIAIFHFIIGTLIGIISKPGDIKI